MLKKITTALLITGLSASPILAQSAVPTAKDIDLLIEQKLYEAKALQNMRDKAPKVQTAPQYQGVKMGRPAGYKPPPKVTPTPTPTPKPELTKPTIKCYGCGPKTKAK